MQLIFYVFVSFLFRNPLGVAAKPLATADVEDDLFDTTPGSLFSTYETLDDGTMDLFAPSTSATDITLPDMSGLDDSCPIDISLEDDEGGSWELEALEARSLEHEGLDLLVESSDVQCIRRGATAKKPKKKAVVAPKEPSLWPLIYPEVPNGQCPYPIRPIAVCCTGRDGMNPFDCWPFGTGLGWCLVGYQFCCRKINQALEGIDCYPVDWGQPPKQPSLDDVFVLPWDTRLLRGPGT